MFPIAERSEGGTRERKGPWHRHRQCRGQVSPVGISGECGPQTPAADDSGRYDSGPLAMCAEEEATEVVVDVKSWEYLPPIVT